MREATARGLAVHLTVVLSACVVTVPNMMVAGWLSVGAAVVALVLSAVSAAAAVGYYYAKHGPPAPGPGPQDEG